LPISESQLEIWSHQGSVSQSRDTYAAVKNALEDLSSPYFPKTFGVFLQGSYGNDTNVYRESDVDVAIRLDSTWYHDANLLPKEQYDAFEHVYPGTAAYGLPQFRAEVAAWLQQTFGKAVPGSKAILIPGKDSRRDCDVLVCAKFIYYWRFNSLTDQSKAEGICFFLKDGTRIVNFPKQHSENCTTKHRETLRWFKPTVRMYKNMRNHLVNLGAIQDGLASSYFIEGMLSNVPADKFGGSYGDTFIATFNYIAEADRSTFRCANGIHLLLADASPVSWPAANCNTYLNALADLWNRWQ
jgi:hypothetical protein